MLRVLASSTGVWMTTHAEWPVPSIADEALHRQASLSAPVAVSAVVLVAAGVAVGLAATHGQHATPRPPQAVLGQSLHPLAVYQRLPVAAQPGHAVAGEMTLSKLGQPGHSDVLRAAPVTNLHVQYAHVRPVDGHWQIEFIAPKGELAPTPGKSFDVLVHGKALTLFTVEGSYDGTNYAIGAQANWLTSDPAVAVAKALTTSVTVAHCSQSAITENECA